MTEFNQWVVQEQETLLHLEDEYRSKTGVFEHMPEQFATDILGQVAAQLDLESGVLTLASTSAQVALPVQEAYMLLDFLYQHRDALDEAMHRIVE